MCFANLFWWSLTKLAVYSTRSCYIVCLTALRYCSGTQEELVIREGERRMRGLCVCGMGRLYSVVYIATTPLRGSVAGNSEV